MALFNFGWLATNVLPFACWPEQPDFYFTFTAQCSGGTNVEKLLHKSSQHLDQTYTETSCSYDQPPASMSTGLVELTISSYIYIYILY